MMKLDSRLVVMVMAVAAMTSLGACKKKTPAEKLGDAIEDAGAAVEEAAENAAKELDKASK